MKNLVDFTGKHFLVIGASSGIGRTTAITLSKLGANVDVMARRENELIKTISLLEGKNNHYRMLDVTALDSIQEVISETASDYGAYDGLVYSVGFGGSLPLTQYTPDKMQKIFTINFFGFVESVRQITKKGRYNPGMRIVGISSIAALRGDAAHTGYSASKAAMDGAVRSMAVELSKKDICINTVAPGMTNTKMFEGYKRLYGTDSMNYKIMMERQCGMIGETQDIANAIAFLLSPAARLITGICMPVDGGYRA